MTAWRYIGCMKKLTIRLSEELHKKLGHYCVDHDTSANAVIVDLLERFLKDDKKPKR